MSYLSTFIPIPTRQVASVSCALVLAMLAPAVVSGQPAYISRYNAFVGYTYLNSSKIGLSEPGFHIQVGVRPKTWYGMGFDFSRSSGDMTLKASLLPNALQQQLGAQMAQLAAAGLLPPGYQLSVTTHSVTETFAGGPQLQYNRWARVIPFIRPSLGAIHEKATPKAADPITTAVIHQLAPAGKKTDWQGFYGVGGGFDLNATKHLALRIQADFVYDHLFNDILKDGRGTIRFSVGPTFNFGRNISQ